MVIKQKHLIEFQIYYLLVVEMLIDILHFPDIIRYFLDVNCIFLILIGLPKIKNIVNDKYSNKLNIYILFYMFSIAAFSIIRRTPVGQVLWAARNNYFFIIFFFICAYTLRKKDFDRIMKNSVKLNALNIVCVIYEYFVLHKYGDNLGGMFGTSIGCNGYLNTYLAIITAYIIIQYVNKKATLAYLAYVVLSSMAIAIASELKFYFIELIIIIIATVALTNINAKNGIMIIVGIIALFIGIQILTELDPNSAKLLQDFDRINEYASTTYENQTIARATPFSQINDYFFGGSFFYNLFGYGFGACEDSVSFSWATSAFSAKYGYLGYRNLSTSMIFVETGYVGIIAFTGIFIGIFIKSQQLKMKYPDYKNIYAFTQVMTTIVIANIWYNSTIRREIAYFTFFCLSAFIIATREKLIEEKASSASKEKASANKKSYIKKKNKGILT